MNKEEAREILFKKLKEYRAKEYSDLLYLLKLQDLFEITADSGVWYQIEIQAFWDDEESQNLRVVGSIDDGGLAAFMPMTDDFILAPSGRFIDE